MGKLQFCTPLWGRRGFLGSCVLLGVGAAVFGVPTQAARRPVEKGGFVLISGWVLPSQVFKDEQA